MDKLTELYVHTDLTFGKKRKRIKPDWDIQKHKKYVEKWVVLFAFFKEGILIISLPFFASFFAIFVFGKLPAKFQKEIELNIHIAIITSACCIVIAIAGYIFHSIRLKKYKEEAFLDKAILETKAIIKS